MSWGLKPCFSGSESGFMTPLFIPPSNYQLVVSGGGEYPETEQNDRWPVVFRKEWYRKTGKEVIEGRPLLHRLLGSILKDVESV